MYCESGNLKKCFVELLLRQEYKTIDYKRGEQECQARALFLQQGCLDLLTIFYEKWELWLKLLFL